MSYLLLQLRLPLYISQYLSAVLNISLSLATALGSTQYHFYNSLVTSYILYNYLCRIATLHHILFVLLMANSFKDRGFGLVRRSWWDKFS